MMVFPGIGGNGDSQTNGVPPYDNIWPHSSDLQGAYTDANGEKGYVSDDQSHDLEGRPLSGPTRRAREKTTTPTPALKVFTRVGPYNVNPETAIAHASVISHEYGHSLGLPDYYSTGSRETYGVVDADGHRLLAEHRRHRQEGARLARPARARAGRRRVAAGWQDTKNDTHRIDWKRAGRHAVHARAARPSTTARPTSPTCRGGS